MPGVSPKQWRTSKVRRTREDTQMFVDLLEREMPECEWYLGGSWARKAPTIGDLDVMVVRDPPTFKGQEVLVGDAEDVEEQVMAGQAFMETGRFVFPVSFRSQRGGAQIVQGDLTVAPHSMYEESIHVDFWCVPPVARGAFKMFIIGPKDLNVAQRAWALRKGFKLSQLGLFEFHSGEQVDDGTEEDIYRILDMPWLEPYQRQAFVSKSVHGKEILVWGVPSDSSAQVYRVAKRGDGLWSVPLDDLEQEPDWAQWSCRCKGYEFSRDAPKRCKHIRKVWLGGAGEPRLEQARDLVEE